MKRLRKPKLFEEELFDLQSVIQHITDLDQLRHIERYVRARIGIVQGERTECICFNAQIPEGIPCQVHPVK